ncbi:MAG: hypothetical protein ACR2GG_01505 [Gemmatimonadaceae bacterium]
MRTSFLLIGAGNHVAPGTSGNVAAVLALVALAAPWPMSDETPASPG